MKKCPCCGFEPTPTNKQLLKIYRAKFGDWPVMEMIERGWLRIVDKANIAEVEKQLFEFFHVCSREELESLVSKT